jgi:hypothetical protein
MDTSTPVNVGPLAGVAGAPPIKIICVVRAMAADNGSGHKEPHVIAKFGANITVVVPSRKTAGCGHTSEGTGGE